MNLFKSGGHSSYATTLTFGYVVVQYISSKLYYWKFLIHPLLWPQEGPKDKYFDPK